MTEENKEDWDVGFGRTPSIQFHENGSVEICNVRNFRYECSSTHAACWETRTYDLQTTCFVDFIVVPFAKRSDLAHTMVSFGFNDGRYLSISVEARRKVGQVYSVLKGLFRAYPLVYVIADERDVIGHRTECRGDDVHLYRSAATPKESACFLRSMLERADKLHREPENYNTLLNNCLTNLRDHVNAVWPKRVPWHWEVLLSGHADHLAYKLGLLKHDQSFETISKLATINDLSKGQWHRDDFSHLIRTRLGEYCLGVPLSTNNKN